MDRQIVYTGALPQTVDILDTNKFAMFGLGYGMQMVLGTGTYVDGLACLPTTPTADLNVHVQVGSIYTLTEVDANAYGDLGTDTTSIVKQGINPSIQTFAITPPSTGGFSQVFLIQAIYNDVDTGGAVLSYYNASNPASPWSGPNNAGTSNNTIRQGKCAVAVKAGVAASTGTQTTPAPDAGYTGLFAITVANGATQITSGNIVQLSTAPIVSPKLPQIPADVQDGVWVYALDSSAGGAAQVTNGSTVTTSAVLNFASVPSWVTAGMKAFDLTTVGAITGGQTVLSKTGTTVTLSGNVNATVQTGDSIAFSNNALVASIPVVNGQAVAPTTGMKVNIQSAGTISGAATFNLNGNGAVAIHRSTGTNVAAGDITANQVVSLIYDGAAWQIVNFSGGAGGSVAGTTGIPYGSDTSTSSNTITVAPSPVISSLAAGQPLLVKLANPITGATTINVSGQSAASVLGFSGQALAYGAGRTGEVLWLVYDGTNWQLINPPVPLQANLTIYVDSVNGLDTYDGSQATVSGTKGPLQHIQTAVNKAFNYGSSQYVITIQCANGTYNENIATPGFPGPTLVINGNISSPSSVVVQGQSGGHTFACGAPNTMTVKYLKAIGGPSTQTSCFYAGGAGANLSTVNCITGSATWAAHECYGPSTITVLGHTYSGNMSFAGTSSYSGTINWGEIGVSSTFTISTAITVTYWATGSSGGAFFIPGAPWANVWVNPGNVTGQKYFMQLNSVFVANGQGVSILPGTVVGTTATGGQYSP